MAGVCSPAPEGCCTGVSALGEPPAPGDAAPAGAAAPPMRAITWLGVTVSPSRARIADSTPSAGAETSTATLSVSISTSTSSRLTWSPTFLDQFAMVPSVTLSPITGTVTSAPAVVAGLSVVVAAMAHAPLGRPLGIDARRRRARL